MRGRVRDRVDRALGVVLAGFLVVVFAAALIPLWREGWPW